MTLTLLIWRGAGLPLYGKIERKKEACHEKMLELGRFAGPGFFACSPGRLRSGPKTEGREDRGLAGEDQWAASGLSL